MRLLVQRYILEEIVAPFVVGTMVVLVIASATTSTIRSILS